VVDEDYWPIMAKADGTEVLATTPDAGGDWPMLWTHRVGKGRVFCTILGHYLWTFDDPLSRALILRGMAWAAGESTNRWESLALDGVTLKGE
jgi:type 1 glutamine amidotransferase